MGVPKTARIVGQTDNQLSYAQVLSKVLQCLVLLSRNLIMHDGDLHKATVKLNSCYWDVTIMI